MKKYYLYICFIFLILCSCSHFKQSASEIRFFAYRDQLSGNWLPRVNTNPKHWDLAVDSWFYTGSPNSTERKLARNPRNATIQTVNVPNFSKLYLRGNFQVQIAGNQEENSLYLVGTKADLKQLKVYIGSDNNSVRIAADAADHPVDLSHVIIRMGVGQLQTLCASGMLTIEGKNIVSRGLQITSFGNNQIVLAGPLRVSSIKQHGRGSISILNTCSPNLKVFNYGMGIINLNGRVGIQYISNYGNGKINIIGASSNSLTIRTGGSSLTTIQGIVNLKNITACDYSRVFLYYVKSPLINVTENECALVGIAGCVKELNVNLQGESRFDGKFLHARKAYVKTYGSSHANVSAYQDIFASSNDSSSIYTYGKTKTASENTSSFGIVLPVRPDTFLPMPR